MRNIELKARCADLARAAAVCDRLGARHAWTRRQVDMYFGVPEGRLKLREEEGVPAVLVAYQRADEAATRECRYDLTAVADAETARAELAAKHGVVARVEKTRTLYLLGNIRIHLDRVVDLGRFIEFEAVMGEEHDDATTQARLRELREAFGIGDGDLVAVSYADLVDRDA
jgi:predicted adenylyl cyclase CyaB